jgi:hypothetical protein
MRQRNRADSTSIVTYLSFCRAAQRRNAKESKNGFHVSGINLRIPLKWGTEYGEVGQRRSAAKLVTVMISEVPHLGQDFCCW